MSVFLVYLTAFVVLVVLFKIAVVVPERQAVIIERLGKYSRTLYSGFHLLVPFIDRIAYRQNLKEDAFDVDPQVCITSDNVQVQVDGVLYAQVIDPVKASYGIENYRFAVTQLAKTTMRSEIGKLELDNTFSERVAINDNIVRALDEASENWGIKVTRYEIRDITPTNTILEAMESQMRAERIKRADILSSEGKRAARVNVSLGDKEDAINRSMGEKQRRINIAEGRAKSIEITSVASAEGLNLIAEALSVPGGKSAVGLRLAESYIDQFRDTLANCDVSVYPSELAGIATVADMIKSAGKKSRATESYAQSATRQAKGGAE